MTSEATTITDNLRLGIEAARTGQYEAARTHLRKVLAQDPDNIPALFWLAFAAPVPQESVHLLERVLVLDPDNERAKAGIRWAKERLGPETTEAEPATSDREAQLAPAQTAEASPEMPDEFIRQQLLPKDDIRKRAKKGVLAHRARRTLDPFLTLLVIIGTVALLIVGIWALVFVPSETLAAWLPVPAQSKAVNFEPLEIAPVAAPTPPMEASSAPLKSFTSEADTIIITPRQSVEINLTEPEMSTRLTVPEPVSESNEVTTSVEESQVHSEPPTFIGPAELSLTGPRLFQPVDESLLAHQPASPDEKWIEVDVTEQRVTAWEGNVPVMSFLSSTGLPNTPTVLGEFNVNWKLESTLMSGPGYYLPGVPYTMYFYGGYALHGTYWHDNFGQPMSHGCVNLSTDNAKELFEWAEPVIPSGQTQVVSTNDNPGTLVVVHQ